MKNTEELGRELNLLLQEYRVSFWEKYGKVPVIHVLDDERKW